MAVFDVFWDQSARVLLAACAMDELGLEEAIVFAERVDADGLPVTCGLFEIRAAANGMSDVIALSIPQDDAPVQLRLEVVGNDDRGGEIVRDADDVVLNWSKSETSLLAQTTKWCVAGRDKDLAIEIDDGQEQAPDHLVSAVYLSPREGANVYPAVEGETDGEGAVLSLDAKFVPSREEPDDPSRQMLEITLSTVDGENSMNTTALVYTLSASLHVLPLLEQGEEMRLSRDDNYCTGELRVVSNGSSSLRMVTGQDSADTWGEYISNLKTSKMLDVLDRLVVETSPPATFIHADALGNPQRIGKKGVAVLALGPRGDWHADDGKLVDRVLLAESSFSKLMAPTFASDLSESGYTISAADLQDATEIVVFAYASTARRMTERLGAMARNLAPRSCKAFCEGAEVYSTISLWQSEAINRRSVLGIGRSLQGRDPRDAIRMLAVGRLKAKSSDRVGFLFDWAHSTKVDAWAVYAAAIDDTIFDAAVAGLVMAGGEIAMFLGDADNPLAPEFRAMSRHVHTLVAAGIMAPDTPDALEDVELLDDRANRLAALRRNAIDAVTTLNKQMGPFEKLPNSAEACLGLLADFADGDADEIPRPDRVTQFFTERASEHVKSKPGSVPADAFCERLGRLLQSTVKEDARRVEQLIEAGLDDPIELASDNVVAMGLGEGGGVQGFVGASIDPTLVDWMKSAAPSPAIITKWRGQLLAVHEERKSLRMTTGS